MVNKKFAFTRQFSLLLLLSASLLVQGCGSKKPEIDPDAVPLQDLEMDLQRIYNESANQVELSAALTSHQIQNSLPTDPRLLTQAVTVLITGGAEFDMANIPTECERQSRKSLVCTLQHENFEIADEQDPTTEVPVSTDALVLPILGSSGSSDIGVEAVLNDPSNVFHSGDTAYAEIKDFSSTPMFDFALLTNEKALVAIDTPLTVTTTIDQLNWAPLTDLTLSITPSNNIAITDVKVVHLESDALVDECTYQNIVSCEIRSVETGDSVTVDVTYTVSGTEPGDIKWSVASELTEIDESNNAVGTLIQPLQSTAALQSLINAAAPGSSVQFPAGAYTGILNLGQKEIDVIGSEGAHSTELVSTDLKAPLFKFAGSRTTISNLVLRTTGAPILASPGENVTIENSIIEPVEGFSHTMDNLVRAFEARSYRLKGNRIRNWGLGEDNTCESLVQAIPKQSYASDVYLEQNVFENNDCSVLVNAAVSTSGLPDGSIGGLFVNNNTIVNSDYVFQVSGMQYNGSIRIINNIIVGAKDILELVSYSNARNDWLMTSNNIVWESDDRSILAPIDVAEDGISADKFDVNVDPMFTDAEAGDYTLKPGSPAIDSGVAPAPYVYTYDNFINENRMPQQDDLITAEDGDGDGVSQFDVGAVEFSP